MRKAATKKKAFEGIAASYRGRCAAAIAAALGVSLAPAARAGPPVPAEWLAQAETALLPGRTAESLGALRAAGRVERGGVPVGTFETIASRSPRALRESIAVDGVREVITLLGDEGWIEDANGAVRSASGDELTALRLAHALLFHEWLDGELPGFAISADTSAAGPAVCFVADRPGPGRCLRFDVLPGGGLLPARFESNEQGTAATTAFGDWRVVEGMRFPFVARQSGGDPRFDIVTTTELLTLAASLPPGAIERPHPHVNDDVAWTDRALAQAIPLRAAGPLWALEVTLNHGEPGLFLLDTGAGATVVATRRAAALDLPRRGVVEARGAGGSEAAAYVDVERLVLPGVEIRGQTLVALPLDALTDAIGVPLDGILGWDFLSRFQVEIDRAAGRVALFEPGTYRPRDGAVRVPLRLEANVPRIEGVIEGHAGSFLLDTGNAVPLLLHSNFAARHGFAARATESTFSMAGIGGAANVREVSVAVLTVGALEFRNVNAVLAPDGSGVLALQESVGNVGAPLFGRSVLALDYGAGALWVSESVPSAAATADSASVR